MDSIVILQQIETELKEMHFPITKEINLKISNEEERETTLQKLCAFWHTISLPICHPGYINYENEILKLQVRTQNATHINFLHRIARSNKLLLDVKINFQYHLPTLDYDYEIMLFHRYIGTISFDFVDYVTRIPTGVFAYHNYSRKNIQKESNGYANYDNTAEWERLDMFEIIKIRKTMLYAF